MALSDIPEIAGEISARIRPYAHTAWRISMSLVFLYFGTAQLIRPESFIGWLPAEASLIPLAPRVLILINGGFEVLFGSLLFLGIFSGVSAFLLGSHLAMITLSIGLTEIGVRDFGLAAATIALAFMGPSPYSVDTFFKSREKPDAPG